MSPRDPAELYKDKVEVSLDGRQIFYLFFGGAVIVGMVFVLGVLVGRRVEARGHVDAARTGAAADPLAALDRLEIAGGRSFQGALAGGAAGAEVERAIGELARARTASAASAGERPAGKGDPGEAAPAERSAGAGPEPARAAGREPAASPGGDRAAARRAASEPEADGAKDARGAKDGDRDARRELGKDARGDGAIKERDAKERDKDRDSKDAREAKEREGKEREGKEREGKEREAKRARYTLQLSSFQDKQEAESFMATLKAAGYQPSLTEATVAGKGTFYRVRLGTYRTLEAANDARGEVERAVKKPTSVMRL
jgi:cell division protein FtsN